MASDHKGVDGDSNNPNSPSSPSSPGSPNSPNNPYSARAMEVGLVDIFGLEQLRSRQPTLHDFQVRSVMPLICIDRYIYIYI